MIKSRDSPADGACCLRDTLARAEGGVLLLLQNAALPSQVSVPICRSDLSCQALFFPESMVTAGLGW